MEQASEYFVQGAKVWVEDLNLGYREDEINKVHKTGRFTLKGTGAQQYSATNSEHAYSTGRGDIWSRPANVYLKGSAREDYINETRQLADRRNLIYRIQNQAKRLDPKCADAMALQAIDRALVLALEGQAKAEVV